MPHRLTAPLLDAVQVELLRDALGEAELLNMFSELPAALRQTAGEVRAAEISGDIDEVRRTAHVLKGLAGSFGAARVAVISHEIERAASILSAEGDLALLARSVEATVVALEDFQRLALAETVP